MLIQDTQKGGPKKHTLSRLAPYFIRVIRVTIQTHRTVNFMNEYKLLIRSLSTSVPQKTLRTMCEYTYTYVNSNRNNIHVSIVDFITLENCMGLTKKLDSSVIQFIMYDYCLIINNDKWDIVVSRQHALLHYIGHIISLVSILNIAILHANLPLNCLIYWHFSAATSMFL